MRALDDLAMFAEAIVLLDATAGDSWAGAPLVQMASNRPTVKNADGRTVTDHRPPAVFSSSCHSGNRRVDRRSPNAIKQQADTSAQLDSNAGPHRQQV